MDHIAKIAAQLPDHGLDAMMIVSEPGERYALGFQGEGLLLVTKDGAQYSTDGRYIEAARERIAGAEVVLTTPAKGHLAFAKEHIQAKGLHNIGFESGAMTVDSHKRYAQELPCILTPAQKLLDGLRASKDEEELALMRRAQAVTDEAFKAVLNFIRPGMTEREIAARLVYELLSRGGEKVYNAVLAAQKAGINAARAGVAGKEIDAAARRVLQEAGYGDYFSHSFGHSLGVEIHESPNASAKEDRLMPVGAVISAEPGVYIPGRLGVRIEDVLILKEGGCEDITCSPKDLIVL